MKKPFLILVDDIQAEYIQANLPRFYSLKQVRSFSNRQIKRHKLFDLSTGPLRQESIEFDDFETRICQLILNKLKMNYYYNQLINNKQNFGRIFERKIEQIEEQIQETKNYSGIHLGRYVENIFKEASYILNSDQTIYLLLRKVQLYFKELYKLYESPHSYEDKLLIQETLDLLSSKHHNKQQQRAPKKYQKKQQIKALTMKEKLELAENLPKLNSLEEVWNIVKDNKYVSDTLEFDIELLPNRVARNLFNYVTEKMGNPIEKKDIDIDHDQNQQELQQDEIQEDQQDQQEENQQDEESSFLSSSPESSL